MLGLAQPLVAQQNWPYTPVGNPQPPAVSNDSWCRNPIDRFILARLESNRLAPAAAASREILLRRIYFDLIGLPPSPAERQAFLDDKSPRSYETVVDRLLKDPRHGERWARFWLDLARYADTAGYEGDPDLPHAWRYRDYVIDSLNRDKAYDLFIREQLAGDEFAEVLGAGELPLPQPRTSRGHDLSETGSVHRAARRRDPARDAQRDHRNSRLRLPRPDCRMCEVPRPQA